MIAHSTSNLGQLVKCVKDVEFNEERGGFEFQNEPVGKGPSEFLEIVLSFTHKFGREEIESCQLDVEICRKFNQFYLLQNEKNLGVRIPEFLGMRNVADFLEKKMEMQLGKDFIHKTIDFLENGQSNDAGNGEELNLYQTVFATFSRSLKYFRDSPQLIKKYKLFAANYFLIVIIGLEPFSEFANPDDPVGSFVGKLAQEYLAHFGRKENILAEIWSLFRSRPSMGHLWHSALETLFKTQNRSIDLLKLENLTESSGQTLNMQRLTSHLIASSKEKTVECIQVYRDCVKDQPSPAKGHRVPGDEWLVLVLNSLLPANETHWVQCSTRRSLLAYFIAEKVLKKSKYNFDATLALIKSGFKLGALNRLGVEYSGIDMKGNQSETLACLFYKNYLELQILETESRENLLAVQIDNFRKVRRFNNENLLKILAEKCFWRMEEIELWGLAVENSYMRGILSLSLMESAMGKLFNKQQELFALENCLWWFRTSFGSTADLRRYVDLEKTANGASFEERLAFGTFSEMRFLNLDLTVPGNDYGIYSDRNVLRLMVRLWQLVVLCLFESRRSRLQSERKKAELASQSGATAKSKKKKKKKKKKQIKEVTVEEAQISRDLGAKIQEEEDLIGRIGREHILGEIGHLVSQIVQTKVDLDYFCVRSKIFENNFQKWKASTTRALSNRLNDELKDLFRWVWALLNQIFGHSCEWVGDVGFG